MWEMDREVNGTTVADRVLASGDSLLKTVRFDFSEPLTDGYSVAYERLSARIEGARRSGRYAQVEDVRFTVENGGTFALRVQGKGLAYPI